MIAGKYLIVDLINKKELLATPRGKLRYTTIDLNSGFLKRKTQRTKLESQKTYLSPKVGDYVLYEEDNEKYTIIDVLKRKNELVRPDVANIDQVILVFSLVKPDFSFYLLDKFLVILALNNLKAIIVITKIDLVEEEILEKLKQKLEYYQKELHIEVYFFNSKNADFEILKPSLAGRISVLAGQTGAGKSTFLNGLIPGLSLKTSEISEALGRGKHTTTYSALYQFGTGYIADTPGFSKIEFQIFELSDLKTSFPDFEKHSQNCKFKFKCYHLDEPLCGVKEALKSGKILKERYDNYLSFISEVKNQKPRF